MDMYIKIYDKRDPAVVATLCLAWLTAPFNMPKRRKQRRQRSWSERKKKLTYIQHAIIDNHLRDSLGDD